jgi:hypothetical protein
MLAVGHFCAVLETPAIEALLPFRLITLYGTQSGILWPDVPREARFSTDIRAIPAPKGIVSMSDLPEKIQSDTAVMEYVRQLLCRYVQIPNAKQAISPDAQKLRLQRVLETLNTIRLNAKSYPPPRPIRATVSLLPATTGFAARDIAQSSHESNSQLPGSSLLTSLHAALCPALRAGR